MKLVLLGMIRLYRRVFSPMKPHPTCRFLPTCSAYAAEAIESRGALVGGVKALGRVLRCNPFFEGGYDPVDRANKEVPGTTP